VIIDGLDDTMANLQAQKDRVDEQHAELIAEEAEVKQEKSQAVTAAAANKAIVQAHGIAGQVRGRSQRREHLEAARELSETLQAQANTAEEMKDYGMPEDEARKARLAQYMQPSADLETDADAMLRRYGHLTVEGSESAG
jgi:hypothetical protein